MTSRERVRAVLNHQIPDRIPNGLGGCETEGFHVVAYDKLQQLLGVERKPPRLDTFMTNAVFELPVIRAMEGDIVLLASPNMCSADLRESAPGSLKGQWKEQTLWGKTFSVPASHKFHTEPDGTIHWDTFGWECPPGSYFFDKRQDTDLLAEVEYPDPDAFHPRDTYPDEFLRKLEHSARRMYEETNLCLCLGESITDLQYCPGGMVGGMVLMLEEPEIMRALLDKCADAALRQISLLEEAVGKYVDILSIAHDMGDNRCVTVGADLWRYIYKDAYRKLFGGWRQRTDMKINLHSCGAISDVLPDLIDCGLQVLNPVQISANNMSPASLKERFGKDLVFWGGAYDPQLFPAMATYEEVYAGVRENCRVLGKDGGFIFSGVHNQSAVLPEHHIRAMLDAWRDVRAY